MTNTITINTRNEGEFFGSLASPYAYRPELRKRLDELFTAAQQSTNRHFVLDGEVCLAAQSTKTGAMRYMTDSTVLVEVRIGCGKSTHVEGTNGGTMPCGALFNGEPYLCFQCEQSARARRLPTFFRRTRKKA